MSIHQHRLPQLTARRRVVGNIVGVCWRQWRTERALARRGVRFRSTVPATVAAAYAAMTPGEFDAINGPQAWANWRTIPRAVRGRLPDRPCRVIDLGCGTGTSTQVLAYCTPPGSTILGYELAPHLAALAGRRDYAHRGGHPANVRFVCQAVTEAFRGPDGNRLANQSIDLVNASGVVGHHLNAGTIRPLVAELRRVVRPGGLAVLDDGPTLPAAVLVAALQPAGFSPLGKYRCWPLARGGQVAFRRTG